MIKNMLLGMVAVIATLGGASGVKMMSPSAQPGGAAAVTEKLASVKLDRLSIPVIRALKVQGYAIVSVSLTVTDADAKDYKDLLMAYGNEAVLRVFYEDVAIDFTAMRPAHLADVGKQITKLVNQRLGRDLVKEVSVGSLSFIAKGEERKGNGH